MKMQKTKHHYRINYFEEQFIAQDGIMDGK